MKIKEFKPKFVSRIPDNIEEGYLYICLKCDAIMHKCPCGCREIVSTPIRVGGWSITYNEFGVSLKPSIGNWSYDCSSHYYITNNKVVCLDNKNNKYLNNRQKKRKKWWNLFKCN